MMTVTVSFWNKHIWMNLYLRYPEVTHSRTVTVQSRCASAHRRSDPSATAVTTETLTVFTLLACATRSNQNMDHKPTITLRTYMAAVGRRPRSTIAASPRIQSPTYDSHYEFQIGKGAPLWPTSRNHGTVLFHSSFGH